MPQEADLNLTKSAYEDKQRNAGQPAKASGGDFSPFLIKAKKDLALLENETKCCQLLERHFSKCSIEKKLEYFDEAVSQTHLLARYGSSDSGVGGY